MNIISVKAHGILDYGTAIGFSLIPTIFKLTETPVYLCYALAVIHLLSSGRDHAIAGDGQAQLHPLANDRVLMGAERKSMLLSDEGKKVTPYPEAGHAIVAALMPHVDPVHKVTIIPRGMETKRMGKFYNHLLLHGRHAVT